MLKINLHKKLSAYNEAVGENQQEILVLKEVEQLLNTAEQSDINILKSVGLDRNLKKSEKLKADKLSEILFTEVYDISVIKKLAINYRLRFLPSKVYAGTIDPKLPILLRAFCEKHNIHPSRGDFYILAPAASFDLEERPKDPIMFYQISKEKYAFIHKWGNDLSLVRYVLYAPLRSKAAMFFSWFYIYCFVSLPLMFKYNNTTIGGGIFLFFVGFSITSAVIFIIYFFYMLTFGIMNDKEIEFSHDVWDSEFKN